MQKAPSTAAKSSFSLRKTDLRAVQYVRFPSGPPPEY